MKKIIRLTESDLHRIIEKSVNRIVQEANWSNAIKDPYDDIEDDDNDDYYINDPDPLFHKRGMP